MNSTFPQEVKYQSKQISGYDEAIWSEQGLDLVIISIEAKSAQNYLLLKILNETKPLTIVEATKDQQSGMGISLNNKDVLSEEKWKSLGWMSDILMKI